jgi:hypothetical protein
MVWKVGRDGRAELQKKEVKRLKALLRAQNCDSRALNPFQVKTTARPDADIANNSSTRNPAALLMPRSVC